MSEFSIEYLKEKKCSELGCFRYCASGYTLCHGHLWGFPRKMDDEDILKLKNAGVN